MPDYFESLTSKFHEDIFLKDMSSVLFNKPLSQWVFYHFSKKSSMRLLVK